jgi:hypothetical protein
VKVIAARTLSLPACLSFLLADLTGLRAIVFVPGRRSHSRA